MMKKNILIVLSILLVTSFLNGQIYVAPNGDDSNPGTIQQPFATIPQAISVVTPGDTIYVRGGVYNIISTITITAAHSGLPGQLCTLTAYRDEIPILDFSAQPLGAKGISLRANYWHIRGLRVTGAGDNGMEIKFGSNNIIERCQFYRNRDSGMQLSDGSANNQIINCDSYFNADPPDYGDADGFAPKLTVGSGNYFYGCRAWVNSDDGWDGYLRGATDVSTTLENCWTWGNGYLEDGTDPGPQANGNGFKMGGGDNSNSDSLMHHMTLIRCVAFGNKNKGFDQNNNLGSMTLYNCTGYDNQTANYRIQRQLVPGESLVVKNCLSYDGLVQLGSFAVQEANSWLPPFVVTADDFLSLVSDSASARRQPDGSLPEIDFLHLAQGSDLIDAGVDLGFPYFGAAPDLGAFESNYTTSIENYAFSLEDFQLFQNYPNPFNHSTAIRFYLPSASDVTAKLFNLLGQEVATLYEGRLPAGENELVYEAKNLNSGVYFYKIRAGNQMRIKRMVLIK